MHRGEGRLEAGIVGVLLQALLVGIKGTKEVARAVEGGTFAAPAPRPVRLDLCGLLGVLEGICPVLLGGVGCGAVAVKDVV